MANIEEQLEKINDDDEAEVSLPERLDSDQDHQGSKFCVGLACIVVNVCNLLFVTTVMLAKTSMQKEIGQDDVERNYYSSYSNPSNNAKNNGHVDAIYEAFMSVPSLAGPITVVVIVYCGCRATAALGSILVAVGLVIASFLSKSQHVFIGICVAGVSGLGLSFLGLASVITLLENFVKKRLRVIILYYFMAILAVLGLAVLSSFVKLSWRIWFRFLGGLAIVTGVSSIGFGRAVYNRTKYKQLLQMVPFYMVLLIVFFDAFGRIPGSQILQISLTIPGIGTGEYILLSLGPFIAQLLGYLLLFCWKKKGLLTVMSTIGVVNLIVGLSSFVTPSSIVYIWMLIFSILVAFSSCFVKPLLDATIPESFGKENIKIVEGLISFSSGIATLIRKPVTEAIESSAERSEKGYLIFYLSGSMLVVCGIIALCTACNMPALPNMDNSEDSIEVETSEKREGLSKENGEDADHNKTFDNTTKDDSSSGQLEQSHGIFEMEARNTNKGEDTGGLLETKIQ